ncbi:MAG: HIT family protein [Clostridia bacterium]|nr:HIT family protein [Clostridia bacterium]
MTECVFCSCTERLFENNLVFAIYDRYPVSVGHMLIIPKRHISSYFESTDAERSAILSMLDSCQKFLQERYNPDGYNIGINVGEAAGQTVMHLHVHIIPRYTGDIDDPRGGIRGAIPEKRVY